MSPLALVKQAAVVMLALSLSACASLFPQGGKDSVQGQLGTLEQWQVRGKLSVVSPQENATGYLTWKQNGTDYDLFIAGPFGAGSSRLSGNDQQAQLLLPGWKQAQTAASAQELMWLHMGWNFPVADIHYWVKGQPSPNSKAQTEFNEHGLLQTLKQHGWEIRYSRYQNRNGYWLPGLIKISGYDFRFTFAIQEWSF